MAKHRRRGQHNLCAAAVVVGTTVTLANPAQAAELSVPGLGAVNVPGLENLQQITNNPAQILPALPTLPGQAAPLDLGAILGAPAPAPGAPLVAAPSSNGQAIVDAARSKIGSPYVWGAAGPDAFDCSGLTTWAYSQVGKSIPRTSYDQAAQGTPVSRDQLQPGDIVVFYSGASHVGIYTGVGTVVHALTEGTPLSESPIDSMPFHSAVRF
ncbi:NlpC/P60 family protein [Corynebacterium sp. sy017]|uniref:C40 family peptidase n=1 Tax=unclassified Corynebacterium TaxID=2624378 RepID=UPI0011857027|nr:MULTISPECIES: C40 family peptidase [unclassified Corynebacterium]MBP3087986.1 NlpC/P60 family protein [Corynebacterium sp. sy017]QDZ42942.1 NlpC/P60 family protein [Corynebacterium sp. sy039]TSD92516.1 NlpC/P60 family protein [Corynebacterium sp. SY003]